METFLIYSAVLAALFAASFLTKRRFGILGLALAAGSVLSVALWPSLETLVSYASISSPYFSSSMLSVIVVMLPAVALLFRGGKYKTMQTRIIGSLLFAILAFTLLINPLSKVIPFQGLGMEMFARFIDYSNYIIALGLTAAVVDVFFTKHAKPDDKHKKH